MAVGRSTELFQYNGGWAQHRAISICTLYKRLCAYLL